jgi:methyl-accepting chemotaxis protein
VVGALFVCLYWSTASYVHSRSDRAIAAEQAALRQAYHRAGRDGVIAAMGQRIADQHFEGGLDLLADASFAPIAGNLKVWPTALAGPEGWGNFDAPEWKPDVADRPLLRAAFATLPDGYHLLVGKDIDGLDEFAEKIEIALSLTILSTLVLGGFTSVIVTQRKSGGSKPSTRPAGLSCTAASAGEIPLKENRDEWDQLADNLNLMLDRIEGLMGEVKQVTDSVAHDALGPYARAAGKKPMRARATARTTRR